ncbi:DUF4340 domain-containing protein [Agarilytica rhodophyticola]|uniref:DUF4340 domain-containing protein n=1 Tax=Agarilytica rhodophyticola TaxID=1737490 RepID=UPI000B346CB7|nr:DUF4340 domain-containing protein [Agarilytica rhodophyticola]
MMKLKQILGGLLVVQIVLACALYLNSRHASEFDAQQGLISVAMAEVDTLLITDQDGSVTLQKQGNTWVLPEYGMLSANHTKVTDALSKLEQVKTGWPIASSGSSYKRFELTDTNFQRKVALFKGEEKLQEVLMGTSPGYRSIHVRRAGEEDVFSVKLASYDFAAKDIEWLDKALLQIKGIEHIKGADFEVSKNADRWEMASSPVVSAAEQQTKLDGEKVEELVSFFKNLYVQALFDGNLDAKQKEQRNKKIAISISAAEQQLHYEFFVNDDSYYVKRSDMENIFEISKVDYDKISQANLKYIVTNEQDKDE